MKHSKKGLTRDQIYKNYGLVPGEKIVFLKQNMFAEEPVDAVVVGEYPFLITVRVTFQVMTDPELTNTYNATVNKSALYFGDVVLMNRTRIL